MTRNMYFNNLSLLFAILCTSLAGGAVVKGGTNSTTLFYHSPNSTNFHVYDNSTKHAKSKGVCTLEVPTLDLIHEDERHNPIPAGNGSRPGYSKIQICCSGYKLQEHTAFHCVPNCENGCENGNCTAPNICECKKGYIKDPSGKCVPTCPIGCLNGVCSVSRTCSCNAGYTLEPTGEMCLPICKGGCGIGGDCIAPEVCQCKPGFEKSLRGICEYHCDGGCDGGDCVGPNKCSCRVGYVERRGKCEADCPGGCKNGVCTGPNICVCPGGWTLDKTKTGCEPHCDEPCLNGECSGPNQCSCKTGYIRDTFKANRCVAHCPGGCENGVCSAPNFCICNHGYIKQGKGSNRCIKRDRRFALHYELIPKQYDV